MWLEHSLSNVPRWAGDCIALDALLLIHSKNELTSGFEVLCFPSRALHKHGGLSLGMSPSRHTSPCAPLPLPFFFFSPLSPPLPFTSTIAAVFSPMDATVSRRRRRHYGAPLHPTPSNTASSSLALHRKKNPCIFPFFLLHLLSAYSHTRSGRVSGAVHRLQIKAKVNRRGRVIATVLRVIWGGGLVPI